MPREKGRGRSSVPDQAQALLEIVDGHLLGLALPVQQLLVLVQLLEGGRIAVGRLFHTCTVAKDVLFCSIEMYQYHP